MFGNNNGKDNKNKRNDAPVRGNSSTPSPAGVNTIDSGTTIKGNLEAGGDLRIDGKLIGDLVCKAKLIIGPKGFIDGDVDCLNAMIEGGFKGNLLVRDMLTLKESANVTGSIRAKKMAVTAGSKISGQCAVTGDSDPAALPKLGGNNGNGSANPLKQNKQGAHVKA